MAAEGGPEGRVLSLICFCVHFMLVIATGVEILTTSLLTFVAGTRNPVIMPSFGVLTSSVLIARRNGSQSEH